MIESEFKKIKDMKTHILYFLF